MRLGRDSKRGVQGGRKRCMRGLWNGKKDLRKERGRGKREGPRIGGRKRGRWGVKKERGWECTENVDGRSYGDIREEALR